MGFTERTFEVAVLLKAYDYITGPLAKMSTQMGVASAQAEAVQTKLNGFKNMAVVGAAMTAVGAGLAYGITKAVDAAGNLQTSMMGVKTALKLTNTEFQKAMNMSQTMGIPTIFSAQTVAGIMNTAAGAGLIKQAVLDPNVMRQYVNFADVQAQGIKHEDPNEVVASAVKMAHLSQIYSVQGTSAFLDQLNAVLMHTTDTAAQFATTYKYLSGPGRTMGMSAANMLTTTAWLSRMGLGQGRGGTNFADFLQRSVYGSSGTKADAAMIAAGFVKNGHSVFESAQGQFIGIPAAVQIMQDFSKRFGGNANLMIPLLKNIFGLQGERVAMAMTTAGASSQYSQILQQMQSTASVNQTQAAYNKTWQGQKKQMLTTLQDIGINFGLAVLPSLMPILTGINSILGKILKFAQAHPVLMKTISEFIALASAVLLVVGPMMLLGAGIGYLKNLGTIVTVIKMIGTAFSGLVGPLIAVQVAGGPILWIIEGIIVVVALLWLAWKNNWGHIHQHVAAFVAWFKNTWNVMKSWWMQHWQQVVTIVLLAMGPIGWAILALVHFIRTNWATISRDAKIVWQVMQKEWAVLTGWFAKEWKDMTSILSSAWNWFYGGLEANIKWLMSKLDALGNSKVVQWMMKEGHALGQDAGKDFNAVKDWAFGSGGNTTVHVHPGAIVVNAASGQSAKEVASEVVRQLGINQRNRSYGRGVGVVRGMS